ncbi:putative bifunctional diguanylate cyclase/phosphodiesterase [Novosphingobium soli]|uniref:Bifunctional diguanylate cyclase/phosphodiesterase n=1 Tax=Novosphingobium soli TaxID=574956 RepID=A0ABV6CSJ7_9SPHN
MQRSLADPTTFRRHFQRQVLLPVALLAAAVVLIAGFGLYWATRTSNDVSMQRQTRITRLALSSSADQIAYEQQGLATWKQLSDQLAAPARDRAWLDTEIGQWLADMFRHDMTFILDARGQPIYAFVAGRPAEPSRFAAVAADLQPLLDTVGREARSPARGGGSAGLPSRRRATVLTRSGTIFASDSTEVGGRPAAASVMPIAEKNASARGRAVLVSVRFLDGEYLRELSAWHLIDGLRFSQQANPGPGETIVEFTDERGKRIGFFFWRPDLPGTRILRVLAPSAALLILLMFAALGLLIRSLWCSGRRLSATIVDLQASEAQAQHLAFHDVLTGLPNRALFQDRMDQALARARRGECFALLALDLDRFKQVNDTLGHAAGDVLIREFAGRLGAAVRAIDTVARIGGDEFSVLLGSAHCREDIEQVCERILETVQQPFVLMGNQVFVGVSMGVVMVPEAGTDRGELMRKADIALYHAKRAGRGRCWIFAPHMDETVKLRRQIEADLRSAIGARSGLEVHYQPEVNAASGRVLGLEALLRWTHPTRGPIPPEQFIPIAEETGLIVPLGEWVLEQACRVAARFPDLFVAVNLSAVQFRSPELAATIIAIARDAGCSPSQIELEITESVLLGDDSVAAEILRCLREAGFRIALDDFGTGYSSLSYLRHFKVDKIKIDRSFTQNLAHDHEAAAIVTSVVTLGHAMGLTVTAEGVESRDQMHLLSAAGCNELQGYLFARALPETALEDFVATGAGLPDVA